MIDSNFEQMQKLFRYFPNKAAFDAETKAADSNNESYYDNTGTEIIGTPSIKWQDICFIEDWSVTSYFTTQKIYTHGHFYSCGDVDDTISLAYALEHNVHGLADALDVAITIRDIGKNATVENVLRLLREPEPEGYVRDDE